MTNRRQPFIINLLQFLSTHSGPMTCLVNYVSQSMDIRQPCRLSFCSVFVNGSRVYIGSDLFRLLLSHRGSADDPPLLQISSGVVLQSWDLNLSSKPLYMLTPRLCFFIVLNRNCKLVTFIIMLIGHDCVSIILKYSPKKI